MNNLVQYLWQATEPNACIKVVDTIIKDKQTIHWYFYSQKQGKILRKKAENSQPSSIIEEFQRKCNYQFDKLQIGFRTNFSPFVRKIVSSSELIDILYDNNESFIFSNISNLSNCKLFILYISETGRVIKPFSKKYQLFPQQNERIINFSKTLESTISAITLRKSDKIIEAQLIVAVVQKQVYLVFADVFKINYDYFHLSYQYHNEQIQKKKKKFSQQLLFCQTCDQQIQRQDRKQINYQGILMIKTIKRKSKYGLNPTKLYNVCHKCYNLLYAVAT